MNEPDVERVRKHLQSKEVQDRVQKRMQDARSGATVTISRAATLFGFSENQLREWERRGLLKVDRPAITQDSKTSTGHRQYSPDELDKLALIRELMDQNYGLQEIPQNIDAIWKQILSEQQCQVVANESQEGRHIHKVEHLPMDKRVEGMGQEVFWRYFVSQVLRLSLLLICEDVPDTIAGLLLPLRKSRPYNAINDTGDLPKIGPTLVGWLGQNQAFYSFLDDAPSFEFPSDFRIEPERILIGEADHYSPLIIVQRKTRALFLSSAVVETIRRLLELVYEHLEIWEKYFDYDMRDWAYQVTDFTASPNVTDKVLDNLPDMVIALGGKTSDGQNRWNFCALLLPQDASLPLQQRNLTVCARSKQAPPHVSTVVLSVRQPGITFRAYQSGHALYRPQITYQDPLLAFGTMEQSTRSAIAIPISGEDGLSVAALYIASNEANAFSVADQRALRFITTMIGELLSTYRSRQQVGRKLSNLVNDPRLVDTSFRRLYHVNADRYYLFLKGMTLDEARNRADHFRNVLRGEYRIDAQRAFTGRPVLPEGLLTLSDVTVRLGINSYKYKKLKEILGRFPEEIAVAATRAIIMQNFETQLEMGQREGGDRVISWDLEIWAYRRWSPSESS